MNRISVTAIIACSLLGWAAACAQPIVNPGAVDVESEVLKKIDRATQIEFVGVSGVAAPPDGLGNQKVSVILEIKKGWKIFSNAFQGVEFPGVETSIAVVTKVKSVEISFPPSKQQLINDNTSISYYDGTVTIEINVKRNPDDVGPLEIIVNVYPFGDAACGIPSAVRLTVGK